MPSDLSRTTGVPRTAALFVFAILLASYAFFWQSRDWNSASRLMLTYALVDQGTVSIDGLENQTGDKAYFAGRYYTDKLPGFSLLCAPVYALAKLLLALPPHPRHGPALAYWPADYWVTLGSSGVATALAGALLVSLAGRLGCGPRRSVLAGLAYGLATPAYAYATLSYGHQLSALALLGAFWLLWQPAARRARLRAATAGFLTALAPAIEMQVAPVSAVLGLYLVALVIGKRWRPAALAAFGLGAVVPIVCLLSYNLLAFGSPWELGYFHHAYREFARVHSRQNPLGLCPPQWRLAPWLLWSRYRGLFFYAPIVALAPFGWLALGVRAKWGPALVSLAAALAVFVVNLSYPEWTGGWSTGPRLLVPLLPFAMIPVAGLLAAGGRGWTSVAIVLALLGGVLMLLFVGAGARVPHSVSDPLLEVIWPLWRGAPLPQWWPGPRFARTLVRLAAPGIMKRVPAAWQWVQFAPLVFFQLGAIGGLIRFVGPRRATTSA